MSARHRRPPPSARLAVESLESRLPLAGDVGGQSDPIDVSPPLGLVPAPQSTMSAPPMSFSTGLTEAAEDRPWIQFATAAEAGSIVLWVRIAVTAGVSTVQTLPVWGRLNGAASVDATAADSPPDALQAGVDFSSVTGWVFGGAGTDPAGAWPQSLATFTAAPPPAGDGVQDFFIVLQSPSDLALAAATAGAVVAGAAGAELQTEAGAGPTDPVDLAGLAALLSAGRSPPPAGILPDDADAAAWLRDARAAETGSFVLWVGTAGGMPTAMPLFVKFNPSSVTDPLFDPPATRQTAQRFYPADGGAAMPWPETMGDSAAGAPAESLPGAGFYVMHTDSNFEISLMTLLLPMLMRGGEGGFLADETGPDGIAALSGVGQGFVAPPAPTVALERDTGVPTDRITADGRLTVGSAAGARVEYSTDAGRSWARKFAAVEGLNRVAVRQVDRLGQPSAQTTFEFTLDTRAPAKPRIALADGTRPADGNPVKRQAELAPRGLEPAARIEYSVAGGPWVGAWNPSEGQNAVRVRQIDVAGNASQPSAELRFRIDTRVEPLTVRLARDTGWSGTDRITSDPTLVIGGREAGATAWYSIDGGTTWSLWFGPREGANALLVRQIDAAGNVSAATAFSFTLDRVRPPVPELVPLPGRRGEFTVAGQPPGTRLEYSVGRLPWTTEPVTTLGSRRSMRVRFVDVAGNASAASKPMRGAILAG